MIDFDRRCIKWDDVPQELHGLWLQMGTVIQDESGTIKSEGFIFRNFLDFSQNTKFVFQSVFITIIYQLVFIATCKTQRLLLDHRNAGEIAMCVHYFPFVLAEKSQLIS